MDATVQLNPHIYTNNFRTKIWADLISLRVVVKCIEDKTYADFAKQNSEGVSMEVMAPTLNQGLIDYKVIKTFLSMMRNMNDYIDQLIAVISVSKNDVLSSVRRYLRSFLGSATHENLAVTSFTRSCLPCCSTYCDLTA